VANAQIDRLRKNIGTVFLGDTRSINLLMTALFARGHVLIEDVPGVGKTVLARALARSLDCKFSRIQLTPDLLPSDVLGVSVFNGHTQTFDFKQGPIFANIVLADEINRTTPRTQSALLPENQLDRFLLRITLGYPGRTAEHRILTTQPGRGALEQLKPVLTAAEVVAIQDLVSQTKMDTSIVDYVLDLAEATRHHESLHLGVSPRGALALTQACQAAAAVSGRDYVTPDDVKTLFIACCAHRVVSKTYLHNGDMVATTRVLQTILDITPSPR
jgi:MoxR-like ATPase